MKGVNLVKISVVIPVYNVERYLKKCIESIVEQTYSNLEIILVDDGSPDNCGILCDQYAKQDSRIKVIHKENGGLMAAWMDGINVAEAEIVVFVDSDDWIELDMIEKMYQMIEKHDADLVCCNRILEFDKKQKLRQEIVPSGVYDEYAIKEKIYPILLNNNTFLGRGISSNRWAKMIKTNLVKDNMKYCDTNIFYGEDLNIIFPVLMDCKKIVVMEESYYYHYRQNAASIIKSYKKDMLSQVNCLNDILLRVANEKVKYDFTEQIKKNYLGMYVETVKNEFIYQGTMKDKIDRVLKLSEKREIQIILQNISKDKMNYSRINNMLLEMMKHKNKVYIWFMIMLYKMKNR